jgi:23S rRNA (guanosine2251-2'-O)-methyltransferase
MSEGAYLYGLHSVRAMLQRAPQRVIELLLVEDRQDQRMTQMRDLAAGAGIQARPTARAHLDRLLPDTVHQGVVARLRPARQWNEPDLPDLVAAGGDQPFVLMLDGIQDPRNLGACLRTADAVGATAVVVPKDRAASLSAAARKVASGAAETVPLLRVTNLSRSMMLLRELGLFLIGADERGEDLFGQTALGGPLGLVMGAEGRGLRRLTRERCDLLVSLPMAGIVESLNVSVACGILCYEVLRQRRQAARA